MTWPTDQWPKLGDPFAIRRIRNLPDVSVPTVEPAVLQVQVVDMELAEDYEVTIKFMEYDESVYNDTPGNTVKEEPIPTSTNEDIPPAPIGVQLSAFIDPRTGKYAARVEYTAASTPGMSLYLIAVFFRIQNFHEYYYRMPTDARSNETSYLFRDAPQGGGLIRGLTYEVVLAPISPTTGRHYTPWSDRVGRTVMTIPKAQWTLAGSLEQPLILRP